VRDKTDVAVQDRSRLVVSDVESACAGIGITPAFSYHVTATLQATALTTYLEEFQPPPLPVHIVYATGRFLAVKLHAFLDFSASRYSCERPGKVPSIVAMAPAKPTPSTPRQFDACPIAQT